MIDTLVREFYELSCMNIRYLIFIALILKVERPKKFKTVLFTVILLFILKNYFKPTGFVHLCDEVVMGLLQCKSC